MISDSVNAQNGKKPRYAQAGSMTSKFGRRPEWLKTEMKCSCEQEKKLMMPVQASRYGYRDADTVICFRKTVRDSASPPQPRGLVSGG